MTRYAALVRGINLGSHNRIKMPDLRVLAEGLGLSDTATYLQSGNLAFTTDRDDVAVMEREITGAILEQMGLTVPAIIRSHEELASIVAANPFIGDAAPERLHVTFLDSVPDPALVRAIDAETYAPDEFRVVDREIYQHCPKGYGTSKLNPALWERKLRVTTSARNWKTTQALVELTRT
jgi:uncharacterized protein (DUF1697 family)